MRLADAVRGFGLEGDLASDPEVSGVTHDSRRVSPGDLYVALVGERFDGRKFVPEALARGAVAVIGPAPDTGLEDPSERPSTPWLTTAAPRELLGPLASRLYGEPLKELALVGVTGTNGKTTVASLVAAMLDAAGRPAGFLGTTGYRFRDRPFGGGFTTPEASDLFRTLREMRDAGAEAVAMEVSSHALSMGRVAGARFDVAIFTNLSRDHLDFHAGVDDYFEAKRRLFSLLKPGGRAVLNLDDPYGARLAAELPEALTYGHAAGEVSVRELSLSPTGIRAVLATPRGDLAIVTGLVGRYNVDNLLAAVAAAEALDLPHEAVASALAAQGSIPGRMERIDRGQPFPVFVDYAHTDAALAAALRSARELDGTETVAVVFGCGGDRDPGKRPIMGRVAGELADLPIATSDNPRGEDPLAILRAIEEGLQASGNRRYRLVPDRREAIRAAIDEAGPGWSVLVAGKGHEREQIIGDRKLPFSDLEEVERALERRFGTAIGG